MQRGVVARNENTFAGQFCYIYLKIDSYNRYYCPVWALTRDWMMVSMVEM